jgi:hypothetical protein
MRNIGSSIIDAIDWTQDTLRSTRPDAEHVLFALMDDRKVHETEDGFLLEADDDEVHRRKHAPRRKKGGMRRRHNNKLQKGDTSVDLDDPLDELG